MVMAAVALILLALAAGMVAAVGMAAATAMIMVLAAEMATVVGMVAATATATATKIKTQG
jgi:hypothetical protein